MQFDTHDTDVLIAGAGPTGLALAVTLARAGVRCRVVDRLDDVQRASRGKGLQPRSLEVLDLLGAVDRVNARGTTALRLRLHRRGGGFTDLDLRPPREGIPGAPHPAMLILPEWALEQSLVERLAELGGAVERGATALALRQDARGVSVDVARKDGARETIRAAWLVGCDGGRSVVRKALGIPFEGETHAQHLLLADVRLEGLEPADRAHVWFNGDASYLALAPLPGADVWQFQASLAPDASGALPETSLELLRRLLAAHSGRADLVVREATWLSHFRLNERLAARYREGRVFLAGDAAHVHSPAGGQGMNTGIQDAFNLGWKLARVVRHGADASLLDTYEQERRPVAAGVLAKSHGAHTAVFASHPLLAAVRDRVMVPALRVPALRAALFRRLAQLDVGYRGGPLAPPESASSPRAGDRAPDARGLDARTGDALRVFDCLRGPHFTLLLFADDARASEEGAAVVRAAREVLGTDELRAVWVTRDGVTKGAPWADATLRDAAGEVHARYRAAEGTAVLVRPDGYVGYRGGLSPGALARRLRGWFAAPGEALRAAV